MHTIFMAPVFFDCAAGFLSSSALKAAFNLRPALCMCSFFFLLRSSASASTAARLSALHTPNSTGSVQLDSARMALITACSSSSRAAHCSLWRPLARARTTSTCCPNTLSHRSGTGPRWPTTSSLSSSTARQSSVMAVLGRFFLFVLVLLFLSSSSRRNAARPSPSWRSSSEQKEDTREAREDMRGEKILWQS